MATATGVTLFTAIVDDVDDGVTNGAVVGVDVDVDLAGVTPAALFFSSIWTGFGASSTIFYAGSTTVVFYSSFFSSSTTGA